MKATELHDLIEGAQSGDSRAQYRMAELYAFGRQGVPENQEEATSLYLSAAITGNLEAQYALAKRYWAGRGAQRNKDEALKWFSKAASGGHNKAARRLRQITQFLEENYFEHAFMDGLCSLCGIQESFAAQLDLPCRRRRAAKAGAVEGEGRLDLGDGPYPVSERDNEGAVQPLEASPPAEQKRKGIDNFNVIRNGRLATVLEPLVSELSELLLGERIPIDVVNAQTGEIIIPANRKVTVTLLRKLADVYDHLDIDPSPAREKILAAIKKFQERHASELAGIESEYRQALEQLPSYKSLIALRQRADSGEAQARYDLGMAFYTGSDFIEKDIQKARALFLAASEQGHLPALTALGDCYADEEDHILAQECYRKSAKRGDPAGQFRVAQLDLEQDSLRLLHLAGAQDYAPALKEIADRWANGRGVEENKAEAARWYRKAAERGDPEAQVRLGECYEQGWIVSENPNENMNGYCCRQAAKWYREAAEQGNTEAQKNLARCYAGGVGVVQNELQAAKWYRRAGMQGDLEAYQELGDIFAELGDKRRAKRYYRKAGLKGWDLRHRGV